MSPPPAHGPEETDRERRAARRAALRATHPDLGGSTEEFIAALRAFEEPPVADAPGPAATPVWGTGAAATPPRPTITTTRRSRTARRVRRARRRLRALVSHRLPGRTTRSHTHLLEESP